MQLSRSTWSFALTISIKSSQFMVAEDKKFGKRLGFSSTLPAVGEHLSQFDQYIKLTLQVINGGHTVTCLRHCSLRGGSAITTIFRTMLGEPKGMMDIPYTLIPYDNSLVILAISSAPLMKAVTISPPNTL
ncbi:hypothetical protein L873DRAFT_1246407 [Choiromyces venosus 120613-1]|uniref:Uncharacterized protein n=1 Tax=Choiromyces venosus 120613-1 TaxID=1336337 RepID=A0A3N4JCY1_9PEZI|nr:hypothetical protein L873DRAFT_1246407 [Choiromyces venosus 120613-1]